MIFFRHLKIALVIMLIFVPAYMGQNYYDILGVPRNADQKEIKKSYRNLAMKHHPDKAQKPQETDQMEKINVAYETLSDPKKRQAYDHELTYGRSNDFGYGRNKYYDDVFGRSSQRNSHFNDFGGYNNYYSGGGYGSPFDLKGLLSKLVQFCYDLFFTSKVVQDQTFFDMQTNSQVFIGILTVGVQGLVGFLYRKIKKISS